MTDARTAVGHELDTDLQRARRTLSPQSREPGRCVAGIRTQESSADAPDERQQDDEAQDDRSLFLPHVALPMNAALDRLCGFRAVQYR